jgi:hypothetical protein
MSIHRKIAEAEKRSTRAGHARMEPGRNIASAAVVDVMFDQLRYLAAHNAQCRLGDCADCVRLAQIKISLLRPFLSDCLPGMPGQRASGQAGG